MNRPKAALRKPYMERAAAEFEQAMKSFVNRNPQQALEHFSRAERFGWDAGVCACYRWQCWMLMGEFEEAWRESDRIASGDLPDPNCLWDGSSFSGKRVVIRCLHGYGDAIQFLRYAPLIRRTAARVVVETHPEMVSLLSSLQGADHVTGWASAGGETGDWDQQVEITELPRAFRTTLLTIPARIPYIDVASDARENSRRMLAKSGKPKVGLIWGSSAWNPLRSVRLTDLLPILSCVCCTFYSFQRGPQHAELSLLSDHLRPHDTAQHSPEIVHTAADLTNMDLVITVDTMAAHLAGALGKKVWVMLPREADWRWMLDREDTPWYPTMRLFRQPPSGNWEPVIGRIATELQRCFKK